MSKEKELSFEESLESLEGIVENLEGGELSLEESITLYERGQELARFCQTRLDQAELRVSQLDTPLEGSVFDADDAAC